MLFHTVEFAVFFAAVLLALRWYRGATRDLLLLAASYYFYMAWDPRFGALILASTLIDYGCGIAIEDARDARRRRLYLLLSLTANLGLLGFFKYLGLFATLTQDVLGLFGVERNVQAWEVILPVGISFFTFQSMSHSVDVYRRTIPASRSNVPPLATCAKSATTTRLGK